MYTTKLLAVCQHVQDGDTFKTGSNIWVRLANVCAPVVTSQSGMQAKRTLQNLILNKRIRYRKCGYSYGRIVADVWVGDIWVNAYMRELGYTC